MTAKADFNADEWTTLANAPALAGLAVGAADRGGTLREAMSMARVYQEARAGSHSALIEALLASPPAIDPKTAGAGGQEGIADKAAETVQAATDLLRAKATEDELSEYGDFVHAVCTTVAKAHKEGGTLGFGGKDVSEAEQTVIDRLAVALGPRPGGG